MEPVNYASSAAPNLKRLSASKKFLRLVLIGLTAFLTVVDLFAVQALLPTLTNYYGVTPSAMGVAVNSCTLGMATGGLLVALLSHQFDRRRGIIVSLALLSVPTALLAFAPDLWIFAALRIAQGLCMASAFGLMLAHLGESFNADEAAAAFAAYITGNVASNLVGRLIATSVVDHAGLAANFYVFSGLNLIGAALVYLTEKRVPPVSGDVASELPIVAAWSAHLGNPHLRAAFAIGFCILFAFIGTFTYVNFVLVSSPLSVGMMNLGLIYFVFLPSIFTTPFAGILAKRIGTKPALWTSLAITAVGLPLLLSTWLPAVMAGMTLIAVGMFAAQAIATSYVSHAAAIDRAAASGIYLAAYFSGGLIGTAVLGVLFDQLGWPTTVAGIAVALSVASVFTAKLGSLEATIGAHPASRPIANKTMPMI